MSWNFFQSDKFKSLQCVRVELGSLKTLVTELKKDSRLAGQIYVQTFWTAMISKHRGLLFTMALFSPIHLTLMNAFYNEIFKSCKSLMRSRLLQHQHDAVLHTEILDIVKHLRGSGKNGSSLFTGKYDSFFAR